MILSCTSPPDTIYANIKSAGSGHGKTAQLNGQAVAMASRQKKTGPADRVWPMKKTMRCVTFARAVGHGLNAGWSKCRPPKMAACATMLTRAIWLTTICSVPRLSVQSVGIPAIRHSDVKPN